MVKVGVATVRAQGRGGVCHERGFEGLINVELVLGLVVAVFFRGREVNGR